MNDKEKAILETVIRKRRLEEEEKKRRLEEKNKQEIAEDAEGYSKEDLERLL